MNEPKPPTSSPAESQPNAEDPSASDTQDQVVVTRTLIVLGVLAIVIGILAGLAMSYVGSPHG